MKKISLGGFGLEYAISLISIFLREYFNSNLHTVFCTNASNSFNVFQMMSKMSVMGDLSEDDNRELSYQTHLYQEMYKQRQRYSCVLSCVGIDAWSNRLIQITVWINTRIKERK